MFSVCTAIFLCLKSLLVVCLSCVRMKFCIVSMLVHVGACVYACVHVSA